MTVLVRGSGWGFSFSGIFSLWSAPETDKDAVAYSEADVDQLVSEFELLAGDFKSRSQRMPASIEGELLNSPIKGCLEREQSMVIIGRSSRLASAEQMSIFAEMCTTLRITCHFTVAASDLNDPVSVEIVQQTHRMGHVIMVEPETSSRPSQLLPSAMLQAAEISAERIASEIGVRPTLVRVSEESMSMGQMKALQRGNFIPVFASERNPGLLFAEISKFGVPFLKSRIFSSSSDGVVLVAADLCTGYSPYILRGASLSGF